MDQTCLNANREWQEKLPDMPPLVNGNYFRPWQNLISNAGFSCSFSLWSAVIRRKTKQAAKTDIVNLGTRFISKKKKKKITLPPSHWTSKKWKCYRSITYSMISLSMQTIKQWMRMREWCMGGKFLPIKRNTALWSSLFSMDVNRNISVSSFVFSEAFPSKVLKKNVCITGVHHGGSIHQIEGMH